jgi:hypothetical protein
METWETHTEFQLQTLKERDYLETQTNMGDNIKMDLNEIRCKSVDWIQVAQDEVRWQAGAPPIVVCLRLLIQYIRSCLQYHFL